jgi:hypothetical protein
MKALSIIIICLIILFVFIKSQQENFIMPPPTNTYILLYEGYNQQNLAYVYTPGNIDYNSSDIMRGYLREILKVNLKSFDINLPAVGQAQQNDAYNRLRKIEIWAMDTTDNSVASSESGFYNSYLEPDIEHRANSAKYKMVTQVLPGQHVKMDVLAPVKKIFIIAIM